MLPVISIGNINIMTFPIVLVFAFSICWFTAMKSENVSIVQLTDLEKMFLPSLMSACIFGKTAYTLVQFCKGEREFSLLINGFVFYGGLIGGFVGVACWCLRAKKCFLEYADIIVEVLPLGQAIGRCGCYLNGCCYGKKYEGALSVKYIVDGESCDVFPTWFVEAVCCGALFVVLHHIGKIKGLKTLVYISCYAVIRFFVEFYRGDNIRGVWMGISTSQIISVCLLAAAIAIGIYVKFTKTYKEEDVENVR